MKFSAGIVSLVVIAAASLVAALPAGGLYARNNDYQPTAQEMQKGTLITIADMKTLPGVSTSSVALIGGQAVLHYVNHLRTTKDINVLTTAKGAPKTVKTELLKHFKDRYRAESDKFEVKVGDHWIQVDMVLNDFGPTGPPVANLVPLTKIAANTMPWASVVDLIVTKMFALPFRPNKEKKQIDLSDLAGLLTYAKQHPGQAVYTGHQREWVEKEIHDELFKGIKADLRAVFKL